MCLLVKILATCAVGGWGIFCIGAILDDMPCHDGWFVIAVGGALLTLACLFAGAIGAIWYFVKF